MSTVSFAGIRIDLPRPAQPEPPTSRNIRARLRALWLHATEEGLYDPATREIRPHSTVEIARLWRVSVRTVQEGLASARRTREAIARAAL